MTRPYAEVIGDPIVQSKSPAIHNYWLGKLGMDAEYRAAQVTAEELEEYFSSRRGDLAWRGCNVTMPHKQAVMAHLDSIDAVAASIGAANTIYPAFDRLLMGTNTDAAGFLEPLRGELAKEHLFRMARIIGSGGAARAIVTALAGNGFTLVLVGRNPDKARTMLDELAQGEHHAIGLDHFAESTDFPFDDRDGCLDLLVNASPLGMTDQPPLTYDFSHTPPGTIVYDIVTDPLETPLLREARERGFRVVDGLSMLIGQAAIAFENFFGAPPPREEGDRELRAILTR